MSYYNLENQGKIEFKVLFILPVLIAGRPERILITLINGLDCTRFDLVFVTISVEERLPRFFGQLNSIL